VRLGPHPAVALAKAGARRFGWQAGPSLGPRALHFAARASRRAVKLALVRSSTTAMIVAHPMMIHS